MNPEKMGALIQKLRKEKGLTQKEVAIKLGITDRAVSKWERRLCCPDISLLEDLANILGASISTLLTGSENANEAIKDTINYVKETRKQKIYHFFLRFLSNCMIFLFLVTLLLFVSIEKRFFQKYPTRFMNGFYVEMGLISFEPKIYEDVFDEVYERSLIIQEKQGRYTNEEYESILEYVTDISKDVLKAKETYYKASLSFEELYQIAHSENVVLITSFDYYPTIFHILKRYDSSLEESEYMTSGFDTSTIRNYVDNVFQFNVSSEDIGYYAVSELRDKYSYYANVLSLLMKAGEIE